MKSNSSAPEPEDYKKVFEENLGKYDELILVAISSVLSLSCANAEKAVLEMGEAGKRVHVFDSKHLSTGLGHLVMRTVELAECGLSAKAIIPELEELRGRISTSFITESVDFLYRNGRVSEKYKKICTAFNLHPVLTMVNGELTLKSVCIGRYEKACSRYICGELKNSDKIDKKRAFITSAGCSVKMLERIKSEVNRQCRFENLIQTISSASRRPPKKPRKHHC